MKINYKGKTFQVNDDLIVNIGEDYTEMGEFRHNRAVISGFNIKDRHYANIIDENGKKILPEKKYKEIDNFYEGLALCIIESEESEDPDYCRYLVEYIDVNGNVVIGPIKCAYAKYFYQGKALIRDINKIRYVYGNDYQSYYFIDKEGNKVKGEVKTDDFYSKYPRYDDWHACQNSIYEYEFPDGYKKIYYCTNGQIYDGTQDYYVSKDKKPALVDPSGKLVIPPVFNNMFYANGKVLADGKFFDVKNCVFEHNLNSNYDSQTKEEQKEIEKNQMYQDSVKDNKTKKGISKIIQIFKSKKRRD